MAEMGDQVIDQGIQSSNHGSSRLRRRGTAERRWSLRASEWTSSQSMVPEAVTSKRSPGPESHLSGLVSWKLQLFSNRRKPRMTFANGVPTYLYCQERKLKSHSVLH